MIQPSDLRPYFPRGFGEPRAFFAPGRVNFIGEHTDYNGGFVLPMALDLGITVLGARREDAKLHVQSRQDDRLSEITIDFDHPGPKRTGTWRDYVEGMAHALRAAGYPIYGAELVIGSDLPAGAGLSSSAALEIGVGFALLSLAGLSVDLQKLALAGQTAEHEWVGTRCGIMDQLASARARSGHALLIDCLSLEVRDVPILDDSVCILVADTRVKHSLASSAYNERRRECEASVELLRKVLPHIHALRDVTPDDLARHGHLLSEPLYRRAKHVVTENDRVRQTVALLPAKQFAAIGGLLVASHRSLQHDYEVSCPELDALVDCAIQQKGVHGARMTGGGFGGSIVCLIETNAVADVKAALCADFLRKFGKEPGFLVTNGGWGVHELTATPAVENQPTNRSSN